MSAAAEKLQAGVRTIWPVTDATLIEDGANVTVEWMPGATVTMTAAELDGMSVDDVNAELNRRMSAGELG